ncbi:MAG: protease [Gemmatimonadetes bacterium]|nr:MAG: protease [Gemmatimonadota bacterium]
MSRFSRLFLILFCLVAVRVTAQEDARLLRYPAIHDNQLIFTYAGDLYTVPAEGGIARKLTTHDGYEYFARFSPDGSQIAFTGSYDGNGEVYVMPATGGVPKRLTYTESRSGNLVMGWRDDQTVIFRSAFETYDADRSRLYLVDMEGHLPEALPLSRGAYGSYSPDKTQLAYTLRMIEFRTWKRYRGGMVDDIYIFDFATGESVNLTQNADHDHSPMWIGTRIYFVSDRTADKRMNLFVYDLNTLETRQLTEFSEFDIRFPSADEQSIVFEYGGYIYRFDLETETTAKVPVTILEDRIGGRAEIINVKKWITNYEIAPDGKRALIGARGEIFTVPAKHGPTRNLTQTSGVHERDSKWSPNGKWISYISDETQEDEIYIRSQDGLGEPVQLTHGDRSYKYTPIWSPDSQKLLWADRNFTLKMVDIETKEVTTIAQSKLWRFWNYGWSPDSRWVTYSTPEEEAGMGRVYLYHVDSGETYPVTSEWYASSQPAFSPDGKYLYFISNRDFKPIYSWTEWNHAYQDMQKVYLVTLSTATDSPFKPQSDEVEVKENNPPEPYPLDAIDITEKDTTLTVIEDSTLTGEPPVDIDPERISERVIGLPVDAGTYRQIAPAKGGVYYIRYYRHTDENHLYFYDLAKQEEQHLGEVDGFELSADGKKMLVNRNQQYAIIDAPKGTVNFENTLDLSDMEMTLDRHAEWQQIYYEAWRIMREHFYDPGMHGVPWEAVRNKYQPLVDHVNHRADLTYIIGEMIGELNTSHTYVWGGDSPQPKSVPVGLLGAHVRFDAASGYYQIDKILAGQNWNPPLRSPLTEVGVEVNEGDYLLAVNGRSTQNKVNLYQMLLNTVEKQVTLTVNSEPTEAGAREVVVQPIRYENNLYYYNWVEGNIRHVNEATEGKVGYIHLPDMGRRGLIEFAKYFYPQLHKKALIVDVRGNGGGNVSPMIIERLRRELEVIRYPRNGMPSPSPEAILMGPKVCLVDELAGSDGDLFAYRFRKHNLGKLIGTRTWGGVVGMYGTSRLIDGGRLAKPENATYSTEGEWIIEGYGVDPDIEVHNDPHREFLGIDDQLDTAIEVILEELKTQGEYNLPPVPPFPKDK